MADAGSIRFFFEGLELGRSYTAYCMAKDLPQLYCAAKQGEEQPKICLGNPENGFQKLIS